MRAWAEGPRMVEPLTIDERAIVSAVRAVLPEVQGIYLFGSYADGTHRHGSDVDLGLLLG